MNRKPVHSSNILSVGWENNTLEVQFKNGKIYRYFGVVEAEYKALITSASVGKTFSQIAKFHTGIPI